MDHGTLSRCVSIKRKGQKKKPEVGEGEVKGREKRQAVHIPIGGETWMGAGEIWGKEGKGKKNKPRGG